MALLKGVKFGRLGDEGVPQDYRMPTSMRVPTA
jgi:hypothetical protein